MNPFSPEVSTMTITSTLHSFRALASTTRRRTVHPKALPLTVPSEITDPATAAGAALALCQSRWDEVTLALYLDNQYRLVGHAVVATGWVQAALLTSRPVLAGADACQASRCILIRYRPYGATSPSEAEDRTFRAIAAACSRHGVQVVDHLAVVGSGEFSSVAGGL
jgi:DNA repair protein RadC